MIALRLLVEGAVVRESVFKDGSVAIGRGPESDFVIVDPSVSRRHARIRFDEAGMVWIEDTGSRNGVRTIAGRVERAAIPPGGTMRCWLGAAEVELALASADATVELAEPATSASDPARVWMALAFWAASIAASGGLMVIEPSFWSPWQQDRLARFSLISLSVAVGLPIQAFVLIGLLRIVGRRARVSDALRALAVVSWGWVLLILLARAASYGLSVATHRLLAGLLLNGGVAVIVAYVASLARRGPKRRFFAAWAAAIVLLLAGFHAAGQLAARQAGTPQLDYEVNVPIAGMTGPAHDLDRYLEAARADFTTAERRAGEDQSLAGVRP